MSVKVAKDIKSMKKAALSHAYDSHRVVGDELVLVFHKDMVAPLDTPIIVSFSILELAKKVMYYDYYYTFLPLWPSMEVNMKKLF